MEICEPSRITVDQIRGLVYIGDVAFSLELIAHMANPDARCLWRFCREGGIVVAKCYTEDQVVWSGDGEAGEIVVGVAR